MTQAKTRIVHLAGGQQRDEAVNVGTQVAIFDQLVESRTFRALFLSNYAAIRDECTAFAQLGLAIVAIDAVSGTIAASMCIAAKIGMPNSAIIGRHGMCDLYLHHDPSLSLRHLAVITSPLAEGSDEVRFRLVDLRTATAFEDEHGQRYEALTAEGPLFVRCGGYVLYCLQTGDPTAWPARAEDGWACIPERVYLRSAQAEPDRWQRQRIAPRPASRAPSAAEADAPRGAVTMVHAQPGPVLARARLLAPGEEPMGTLRINAKVGVQTLVIGQQAAQQGIVLGRYERCDVGGVNVLTADAISRVHLLLIEIDEQLYAVDTGSTHGTWLGSEKREVRITALGAGTTLILGPDLASLTWSPA